MGAAVCAAQQRREYGRGETGKEAAVMWQPIESAPRDGTWFMICRADEGHDSYEVGRYDPLMFERYVEAHDGLYRKEPYQAHDWRGFNNFHRATHWMPLPEPPK
jgi:hypothetical protein